MGTLSVVAVVALVSGASIVGSTAAAAASGRSLARTAITVAGDEGSPSLEPATDPTATPSPTPDPDPAPSATPTPTPDPDPAPSATPTPAPVPTPAPALTPTPTPPASATERAVPSATTTADESTLFDHAEPEVPSVTAAEEDAIAPVPLALVPNANTVAMAWVGTPSQRPADAQLQTLQAALNAAAAGQTVSFDPNDYVFTTRLTVPRDVTLDTASASTLFAQFLVTGGGLSVAGPVTIGVATAGTVITVNASGAELTGLTIVNPNGVLRPTGIQLGAAVTGVDVTNFTMDGGAQASSSGINLTTGSASITGARIQGVATGVAITAASTATGIVVAGGTFTATNVGIALGTTAAPAVSGVTVAGNGSAGTGIDLANSSGATIDAATVSGFARGIASSTTNAAMGPLITDATITGATREAIALGVTTGARIVTPDITGTGAAQSVGINVLKATGVTLDRIVVKSVAIGVSTSIDNAGAGPKVISPVVTDVSLGGITLGSTQGTITDATVAGGALGTGINLMNAGRVTVSTATMTGFLYGVGAQSTLLGTSDRADIRLTDLTVVGAANASNGVYILGADNATITDVTADVTGGALVVHQSTGVQAANITVHGHEGPTPATGAAILRAFDSNGVSVDHASIDAGSYGFFYSSTENASVTDAQVSHVVEYGLYGRSLGNLEVSDSSFTSNRAVGLFVVTTAGSGISHDIDLHDNVMSDNGGGVNLYTGTRGVRFAGNTVSGQPFAVSTAPAHDVAITGNTIQQAGSDDSAAILVRPLFADGAQPGSYSSSAIDVVGNEFVGGGTWIRVGSPDGAADADRRAVRDAVTVMGNTFPADSTAVLTLPNAVAGEDTASAAQAARRVVDGPVAVDARDYDNPNGWGAPCDATGYLDGDLYYAGGGAAVRELSAAPVLYPADCIDLTLVEQLDAADRAYREGDLVTWTLLPANDGPGVAPSGWTVTQLLPDGVELVSMTGDAYAISGLTATALADLPAAADGPPLTVRVRITSIPSGAQTMKNVAYVAPLAPADATDIDGDGVVDVVVEFRSPLVIPTLDTDTDASATDDDAQGVWRLAPSDTPPTPDPDPAPEPEPTPAGGGGGSGEGGGSASIPGALPATGVDAFPTITLALLLLAAGAVLRVSARRPRS